MKLSDSIVYVGVNDHKLDLFEGQYEVPNGMAYNSYVILDENIAVLDTVDAKFGHEWLDNVQNALGGRQPDFLRPSFIRGSLWDDRPDVSFFINDVRVESIRRCFPDTVF